MAENLFPGVSNMLRRSLLYSAAKEIETLRAGFFVPPIVGNGAPQLWKLVPVDSTRDMDAAGGTQTLLAFRLGAQADADSIYRAMIEASPCPPKRVLMPELRAFARGEVPPSHLITRIGDPSYAATENAESSIKSGEG